MKKTSFTILLVHLLLIFSSQAQDTFSIVAVDSTTREVGSAGASCVDLVAFGFSDASFLGDLFPDSAAINSQAAYLASNQNNARDRIRLGDSPSKVIDWLIANDAQGNPQSRQYGIVGFHNNDIQAAAHTGSSTLNYANHITGNIDGLYYSIQGNILLGQEILDSMEYNFRNTDGDLACRLMAAMQGANMIGADTRCASNFTSSLFAFLKVSQPTDSYGNPSLKLTVITQNNNQIEPIDSLQAQYSSLGGCQTVGIENSNDLDNSFIIQPNPANEKIKVVFKNVNLNPAALDYLITDMAGKTLLKGKHNNEIDVSSLNSGTYFVHLKNDDYNLEIVPFIKN